MTEEGKKEAKKEKKEEAKVETKVETPKVEAKREDNKELAKEVKVASSAPSEEKKPIRKHRLAIIHVYSSKNDTIITATDMSGAETLSWASGGMMVKAHREEGRPYAAMQAAGKVVSDLKNKGITMVHVRIRAPGGVGTKTPGAGAQAVVRTIARTGIKIGRIEDVTPTPTDSMKRKGGRRGRRV